MATEEVRQTIKITEEALYDYECLFAIPYNNLKSDLAWVEEHFDEPEYLAPIMPREDIKTECAKYITINKSLQNDYYFRAKYYDETKERMLMLFFYKGEKGIIKIDEEEVPYQEWKLKGICFAEDWSEEQEESGLIRNWLKRDIQDEEQEDDWVWTERIRERERLLELAIEGYVDVEDNMAEVNELLKNYKTNKSKLAVMDKTPELELLKKQMDYLDECIKTLDPEEQEFIREICVYGKSLQKVARTLGYCKGTMQYRKRRIVNKLNILFDGKTW